MRFFRAATRLFYSETFTGEGLSRERLAANANCTETQNDVAARNLPAKTAHGLESREQQHLVKLMLHFPGVRSRKNLVANHLALRVHGDIEHQTVRQGELTIVILRGPIAWMNSAPHRANILDPQVDSIGIAIERRGEEYYATQDFAAVVASMTREEQEQQVARLLYANGVTISGSVDDARRNCEQNRTSFGTQPAAIARFETSDLSRLPNDLGRMIASGRFRHAVVGACEVPTATPFARFRLTVLLYP